MKHTQKSVLIGWKLIVALTLLVIEATPASPQATNKAGDAKPTASNLMNRQLDPTGTPEGSSSALSANELAKQISNPVTSLWQLQFQFNNETLETGKWVNNLLFQPVLPVSLTKDINLITRPVITFYDSVQRPTATGGTTRTTSFGDTILAQVLSPAHTEPWIFGAGPTWIFPTAGSDFTGQGKWQVGPAVGGGYIGQVYGCRPCPAMVVFRRRRGPQAYKPGKYSAFGLLFLRRGMERRLPRKHSG